MFGRDMAKMMKQLGMNMSEIDAEEVIIKTHDKDIVIRNPQVSKINVQGQTTFQIVGEPEEVAKEKFSKEDVELVVQQTGCSEEDARKALEETEDMAEAIMKLKEE